MSKKCFKLICPKCKKEFDDCKSSAYHNRENFQCPLCGCYIADSWAFVKYHYKQLK